MQATPQPRISILEAVRRIAVTRKLHPMSSEVIRELHNWLKLNLVAAIGNKENLNGETVEINEKIPIDLWENLSDGEFLATWAHERFLYRNQGACPQTVIFKDITLDPLQISELLRNNNTTETKVYHEKQCENWLRASGEDELKKLGKKKSLEFFKEKYNLPSFSERAFDRAWGRVCKDLPSISNPGAKKKSPQ